MALQFVHKKRENSEILALAAMRVKAKELGVQGVAVVMISLQGDNYLKPIIDIVGRFERGPDPSKGPNDTGASYLAVALTKLAEMYRTNADSAMSGKPTKKGELGLRGGRVVFDEKRNYFFTAFSGGTEDQDVLIAEAGQKVALEQ